MKRILNWFRLRRLESDLDRELQYHIDRRVSDLIHSGLPEPEARRRAAAGTRRRHAGSGGSARRLADSMAAGFRVRPALLGAVFSSEPVVYGDGSAFACTRNWSDDRHLLSGRSGRSARAPGRATPSGWFSSTGTAIRQPNAFGSYNLMSYPICRDLQQQERFFDGVFCRAATTVNLSTGGEPKPTAAELVSGTYFSVLGVSPALGRLLTIDDDQAPGSSPVVVLSYDFWKNQFAGAPDIVGRKVLVNQYPMTVVGVAAPAFHGIDVGEVPSLWIPAVMSAQAIPGFTDMLDRRTRWMQILGRLRQNVSLAQAQAGLQPWFKAMLDEDTRRANFPRVSAERRQRFLASTLELTPAPQGHSVLRRRLSQPLWVLFAATAVLLGLACLNVAGLFLARGSARHREISTRFALGASRGRIGRQLLADSLLLALAGGLLGVVLAPLAIRALIAFLPRNTAANALHAHIDRPHVAVCVPGEHGRRALRRLAPALQAGRRSLISSLRERARHGLRRLACFEGRL